MHFPSKEQIAALRERYPRGTRVELLAMDDPQAPPTGTMGEILGVDDAGQLLVRWATGSSLSLIPGVDSFRIMQKGGQIMNEKVFAQIMDIRDSGRVNMFDIPSVQRVAFESGFYELVCFIEEDRAAYIRFILTGEQ